MTWWSCWYTPVTPVCRWQKQEDHEFNVSLCCTARQCLKKKTVLTFCAAVADTQSSACTRVPCPSPCPQLPSSQNSNTNYSHLLYMCEYISILPVFLHWFISLSLASNTFTSSLTLWITIAIMWPLLLFAELWSWTQGLTYARQAIYHWAGFHSPLWCWKQELWVQLFAFSCKFVLSSVDPLNFP